MKILNISSMMTPSPWIQEEAPTPEMSEIIKIFNHGTNYFDYQNK